MSEQPYTYADIVVGTKKFIKPEEKNTTGDDTQSTDTDEKTKKKDTVSKTDSNNVKKSTTGSKSCLLYTSPSPRDQRGWGIPS